VASDPFHAKRLRLLSPAREAEKGSSVIRFEQVYCKITCVSMAWRDHCGGWRDSWHGFCARRAPTINRMGRTPMLVLCSRNRGRDGAWWSPVLTQRAVADSPRGRAQWKINQPPSLKRQRASLEGSI